MRPNVPRSVFIPNDLDNLSLPDHSTIDDNNISSMFDDANDGSVSCNMHKHYMFPLDTYDSMTNSTIMCEDTDDDSVGNASIASLEVYEVFDDDDIEYCFHGPKIIPKNETPATICTVNTIGTIHSRRLFRILLDSGASCCLIKRSSLPNGVVLKDLSTGKMIKTLSGQVMAQQVVTLRDIRLPEFDKNRRIEQQKALVFDNDNCRYDMILGTNFLSKTGIKLDYDRGEMVWYDCTLPMRPRKGLTSADFDQMEDMYHIQFEDELLGQDWLQLYATKILDARYKWTDVRDIVENQTHLTACQKCDLLDVLKCHQKLFNGTLGIYPHKKVHIDIEPDAEPVHA